MSREIAVHMGIDGMTTDINESGNITVFRKCQGEWKAEREGTFTLAQERGLREMRKQLRELTDFLGDCKVFVASTITGVPYYELEKAGCSVWEFDGDPCDFLDEVLAQEELGELEVETVLVEMPVPVDLGNGYYRISIKEIQEKETGITSKQALWPFIRQGSYYQVTVICNHIPPWLEAEVMVGNLICESNKIAPGEVELVIRKKVCGE